jgi:ComF family protein
MGRPVPVVPAVEHAPALVAPPAPAAWLTALADLLFPPFCPVCRARLGPDRRDPLCGRCWEGLERIAGPVCQECGLPLPRFSDVPAPDRGETCGACRVGESPLAFARSAARYGDLVREAIHAFKFRGRRSLAAPLGDLLIETAARHLVGRTVDLLVPVPLHRRRERDRGFNQAELLARRVGAALDVPVGRRVVVRRAPTAPQTELTAPERWANVRNAFSLARPQAIRGRHVLLVDDLVTTGATARACAACLTRGGAASVGLLTVARVL